MGDLSEHFSAHEFRCKDGSEHPIDPQLVAMLERVREHFDAPVHIVSGYRSPAHNAKVGGAKSSYHTKGMAADIMVDGVEPTTVYQFCDTAFKLGGVGRYVSFTHVDCRPYRARWVG
jgi:uncharacterized protein YcbK (DUF882 family)